MPRDYKPSARKRRQSSRAKPSSRWPWLFGGLAAGVLVSFAAYFLTMRAVLYRAMNSDDEFTAFLTIPR